MGVEFRTSVTNSKVPSEKATLLPIPRIWRPPPASRVKGGSKWTPSREYVTAKPVAPAPPSLNASKKNVPLI
jgi:hypothetical protein